MKKLLCISLLFNISLVLLLIYTQTNPPKNKLDTFPNDLYLNKSISKIDKANQNIWQPQQISHSSKVAMQDSDSPSNITPLEILKSANKQILAKTLLHQIKSGNLEINTPFKENDLSYTPLVAALFLDQNIEVSDIQEFINEGAQVFSTPTWVVAASMLNREKLKVLLDNNLDPLAGVEGWPLTYLALINENFEAVDLLSEYGYPLLDNYQILQKNENLDEISVDVDLYRDINDLEDEDKKKRILDYLNKNNK